VRQPLASLQIPKSKFQMSKDLLDLIKEEVNVKEIVFGKVLKLDAKITPELKEEGLVREIVRNIQGMRKNANLKPKDRIMAWYWGSKETDKIMEKNKKIIIKEANLKDLLPKQKTKERFTSEIEVAVDRQKFNLAIKKVK